jgi:hypothetical protein
MSLIINKEILMTNSSTVLNESKVLTDIDNFIISMYKAYSEESFKQELIKLIPQFKTIYQPARQYSECIKIFHSLANVVDEILNGQDISLVRSFDDRHLWRLVDTLSDLKSNASLQFIKFKAQERRNQKSLLFYLQQLIQHYAKLLFVRVDLAIQMKYQHEVDIQQFNQHLQHFLNRVQNQDTCFNELQGYAWALEQGEQKGYHCHVLLIYNGHKHQNDFGIGLQVRDCWSTLTDQKGYTFISNTSEYKKKFEDQGTLGIGMIHRNQPEQVQNAIQAAMYLVNPEKDKQYLRVAMQGMRSFGRGLFANTKRRGLTAVTH